MAYTPYVIIWHHDMQQVWCAKIKIINNYHIFTFHSSHSCRTPVMPSPGPAGKAAPAAEQYSSSSSLRRSGDGATTADRRHRLRQAKAAKSRRRSFPRWFARGFVPIFVQPHRFTLGSTAATAHAPRYASDRKLKTKY